MDKRITRVREVNGNVGREVYTEESSQDDQYSNELKELVSKNVLLYGGLFGNGFIGMIVPCLVVGGIIFLIFLSWLIK